MVNKLSIVVLFSFLSISLHSEPVVKKLTGKEIVHKDGGGSGSSSSEEDEAAQEEYENQEIEEQDLVLEEQHLKSRAG